MYKFARAIIDKGPVEVECIHNRELTRTITYRNLFFVMGDDFNKKFEVDTDLGEVAIYSPNFEKEIGSAWIGRASDFQIMKY